jgi:hypothetical protein
MVPSAGATRVLLVLRHWNQGDPTDLRTIYWTWDPFERAVWIRFHGLDDSNHSSNPDLTPIRLNCHWPNKAIAVIEPRVKAESARATSPASSALEWSSTGSVAHPIAQLSSHIRSSWKDGLDIVEPLTWLNARPQDPADPAARSLKVATRVRIPLGLLHVLDPVWATAVVRVGS